MNTYSKESAIDLFYANPNHVKVRGIFANGEKSPFISLNKKQAEGIIGAIYDYDMDYANLNQEFLDNSHLIENQLITHVNITDFLKPMNCSYHKEKISSFTHKMIQQGAVSIELCTTIN